jgi:hypothetical protein
MSDGSSSAQTSPLPKLPPIISNERDRIFLGDLNQFIEDELMRVPDTPEERYVIHRAAFDKVSKRRYYFTLFPNTLFKSCAFGHIELTDLTDYHKTNGFYSV